MHAYIPAGRDELSESVPHKTRRHHPWLIALGILLLAVAGLAILGSVQRPTAAKCTGFRCTGPSPSTKTLSSPNQYTSSTYGYSVQYSTGHITPSNMDDSSISWDAQLGDGSEVSWTFSGANPNGRDARQIVEDAQANNFGDATYAFTIPGAALGYTQGYGNVYDLSVSPNGGQSVHERLIILAAVKRNVAVVFIGMGPYQHSDPQNDNHPNPAETPLVSLADVELSLGSVLWPGDPPL